MEFTRLLDHGPLGQVRRLEASLNRNDDSLFRQQKILNRVSCRLRQGELDGFAFKLQQAKQGMSDEEKQEYAINDETTVEGIIDGVRNFMREAIACLQFFNLYEEEVEGMGSHQRQSLLFAITHAQSAVKQYDNYRRLCKMMQKIGMKVSKVLHG